MPMNDLDIHSPQEEIDRYLTGRMTPEEEDQFRHELDSDEALRNEMTLMQLIVRALSIRAIRYRLMEQWDAADTDRKRQKAGGLIHILSAAASVGVMLILGCLFLTRHDTLPSCPEPLTETDTPAPATIHTATGVRGSVRVPVSVIADEINEARSSAQFAMSQIQTVMADTTVDHTASDEEKAYLSKVIAERDYRLRWLRINALITAGHIGQARTELKQFASEDGIYSDEARKLLKEFE